MRSDDGGRAWQQTSPGWSPNSGWITTDPVHPQVLYLPDLLLRSHDAGRTWQGMSPPELRPGTPGVSHDVSSFAIDPSNPDTLFLSGSTDFFGDYEPFFVRSKTVATPGAISVLASPP